MRVCVCGGSRWPRAAGAAACFRATAKAGAGAAAKTIAGAGEKQRIIIITIIITIIIIVLIVVVTIIVRAGYGSVRHLVPLALQRRHVEVLHRPRRVRPVVQPPQQRRVLPGSGVRMRARALSLRRRRCKRLKKGKAIHPDP